MDTPTPPLFTVTGGCPTDWELAALTAVLLDRFRAPAGDTGGGDVRQHRAARNRPGSPGYRSPVSWRQAA